MSGEEETREHRSHWDDLAEQLGVPSETPGASASQKPSPAPFQDDFNARSTAEPAVTPNAPIESSEDAGAAERSDDSRQPEDRPRRRRGRRGGRGRPKESAEGAETSAEEGASRKRGRHAKRTRGGEHRPAAPKVAVPSARPSAEHEEHRNDEDRFDERQRDERPHDEHDEKELERFEDEAAVVNESVLLPATAGDDEDVERISDWNIPSWSEIVASLYRP